MKWRVILEHDPETGDWAPWCPEFPGCASAGFDRDDALTNIREAISLQLTQEEIVLEPGSEVLLVAI